MSNQDPFVRNPNAPHNPNDPRDPHEALDDRNRATPEEIKKLEDDVNQQKRTGDKNENAFAEKALKDAKETQPGNPLDNPLDERHRQGHPVDERGIERNPRDVRNPLSHDPKRDPYRK